MKNFFYIIFFNLLLGVSNSGLHAVNNEKHSFRIDDLLQIEDIRTVIFGPNGQRVIFQKMPPYHSISDFSAHALTVSHQTKLYSFDWKGEEGLKPLFPQEDAAGYFLNAGSSDWSTIPNNGFNDDGSRIIVYRIFNGKIDLGVFDFNLNKIFWLPIEPNLDSRISTYPIWISPDEFIVSAFLEGQQVSPPLKAKAAKKQLFADWQNAWRGDTVTAQVLISSPIGKDVNTDFANNFRDGSLLLVNASTGKIIKIADGLYSSLRLSPDGRYLAAHRHGGELLLDPDYPVMAVPLTKYRLQPVVFDIEMGYKKNVVCEKCDAFSTRVEWSTDSQNLLFFVKSFDDFWHKGRFLRYNVNKKIAYYINHDGLDLAPVSSNRMLAGPDRPSWIGDRLAVFARPIISNVIKKEYRPNTYHISGELSEQGPIEVGRPDWYLLAENGEHINLTSNFEKVSFEILGEDKNSIVIFADKDLWQIKSDGSKQNLTRDIFTSLSAPNINTTKARLAASQNLNSDIILESEEKGDVWIVSFNYITGLYSRLFKKTYDDTDVKSISFDSKVAILSEKKEYSTEYYILNIENKKKSKIIEINGHLKNVKKMHNKIIEYTYKNGKNERKLTSCMVLPPDWNPDNTYPMIVWDYPQLKGSCPSLTSSDWLILNMAPIAASGYIVMYTDHAVDLLSTEDRAFPFGNLTDMVLSAVDAAVAQGYADPDRIGLYGVSLGGIGSLWMLTQTDRFKATVSSYGAANFARMYGTVSLIDSVTGPTAAYGQMGFFEIPANELYLGGARPWEDPQRYTAASAFFSVDKITTPVMLIHSDLDVKDAGEYRQMFSALRRLRKDAIYIEYRGEGHIPTSPANIRHKIESVINWYDKYLK